MAIKAGRRCLSVQITRRSRVQHYAGKGHLKRVKREGQGAKVNGCP